MNTPAFQVLKESAFFLWRHKKIVIAILFFGLVTLGIVLAAVGLFGILALLIFGQEGLLLLVQKSAAEIMPLITPWIALVLATAGFLVMMLLMFYPRVCSAYYIIGLLRGQEVTMLQALSASFTRTIAAWRVVAGIVLFPLMVISTVLVLLLISGNIGIVATILGMSMLLWFIAAIYFAEQLVSQGSDDFMAVVATSWNYIKRSWWHLLVLMITLWIINIICSYLFNSYVFPLIGCIISAWYSIVANKIFLIARSESTYKYSSE